jgi:hypothetical protein
MSPASSSRFVSGESQWKLPPEVLEGFGRHLLPVSTANIKKTIASSVRFPERNTSPMRPSEKERRRPCRGDGEANQKLKVMYSDNAEKSTEATSRPDPATVAGKKREIAIRYRNRDRYGKKPFSIPAKRVAELRSLFRSRYGNELPNDDAGRDDAKLMLDHMAACPGAMPGHLEMFLRQWCPWLEADEIAEMTADAMATPLHYCADTAAERVGLTDAERSKLNIRTIGAIDLTKAERKARRKKQAAKRAKASRDHKRVANGGPTRAEYEANSISRTKPWIAAGYRCRRTWQS